MLFLQFKTLYNTDGTAKDGFKYTGDAIDGSIVSALNKFNLSDEVLLGVPAGSLVFFNPHIVHGSEPNKSDKPRRAFIMTYQPANNPMLKSGLIDNIEV